MKGKQGNMAKRREKGDGSIYQRESDKMWVAYVRVPETGKKKYVYDKTRSGVAKKLKELQRSIDRGMLITAKAETVEAYLRYWLEIHSAKIKETTRINYRTQINACVPHIGAITLTKLTSAHLQKMYALLTGTQKSSTVHILHTVLKVAFKYAVRWKRLARNPCDEVDAPAVQHEERPFLNANQCKILLTAAQGTDIECFLAMALTTGMRRGEMLGLRWADIEMEQKYLSVQRTASYINSTTTGGKYTVVETSTKTKASKRSIRLTDFLIAVLKGHKKKQNEIRLQAGQEWAGKDLVFCGNQGKHFSVRTVAAHYTKLLQENDLPPLHIHDLRHSAATLLASMGIPAKVIQEILGHSSVTVTQNLYGHVIEGMQEEAMQKMDNFFQQNGTK
jgi:integrase